jgi:predicted nuclease of restriction endonuclease-like RecB superfamily
VKSTALQRFNTALPALPLCDRWEMTAAILADGPTDDPNRFTLDHTDGLVSHSGNSAEAHRL